MQPCGLSKHDSEIYWSGVVLYRSRQPALTAVLLEDGVDRTSSAALQVNGEQGKIVVLQDEDCCCPCFACVHGCFVDGHQGGGLDRAGKERRC